VDFGFPQPHHSGDLLASFQLALMSLKYYRVAGKAKKKYALAQKVYDQSGFVAAAPEPLRDMVMEILTEKKSSEQLLLKRIGALIAFVAVLWALYKMVTDL